jgi:hypothetical protein
LAKPNSKLGTTEAIIEDFSLLEDFPFLLEELLLAVELELFDFSELELVGFVDSLLEEVSLLLEETAFSELEDLAELELVFSELELVGFVVSLLEDVSLLLEETVSSELEDGISSMDATTLILPVTVFVFS